MRENAVRRMVAALAVAGLGVVAAGCTGEPATPSAAATPSATASPAR